MKTYYDKLTKISAEKYTLKIHMTLLNFNRIMQYANPVKF